MYTECIHLNVALKSFENAMILKTMLTFAVTPNTDTVIVEESMILV